MLTVAEEVDPSDLSILVLEILSLILLLKDWRWYLSNDL
jgi:hypothetical protein